MRLEWVKKPDFKKIASNIKFGTAVGLTKTAGQGQAASVSSIKRTFTTRGRWYEKGNRFGIKIKAATKYKLESQVFTLADWLKDHEKGATRKPKSGSSLAVPTDEVRRTKTDKILKSYRPRNVKGGRKIFIHGKAFLVKEFKSKHKRTLFLYNLIKSARIRKQSTFFEPIQIVVNRNLGKNIERQIGIALATMR